MKKEEMNRIIGMLDDDVLSDAFEAKETKRKSTAGRRIAIALIAATLAVAMLASGVIIALRRYTFGDIFTPPVGTQSERLNVLPPVGMQIIKRVASSAQITAETEHRYGTYPTPESTKYWIIGDPISYAVAGGLEMSYSLYNSFVESDDANRTWSIEVSISPNLYWTEEYLTMVTERMLAEVNIRQLETLLSVYEQTMDSIDVDALYEQYKDDYDLVDIYKYVKSGKLDKYLMRADIEDIKRELRSIIERCGDIREGLWSELEPILLAEMEKLGIPFVKEGDSYVIFVTEGELLSLAGLEGIMFENAYYKIDVNEFDPNVLSERAGKRITGILSDAFIKNEGENVLFAVLVETAGVGEIGDKSAYEQEYFDLFREYASRNRKRKALLQATESEEKLAEAIELCGQVAVDKYIKDGVFDSGLFDSDTKAIDARIDEMRVKLYGDDSAEVYDAFRNIVSYIEITDQGSVIIYVTAEEFDALIVNGDFVYNLAA